MTELDDVPEGVDLSRGEDRLGLAARQLRAAPPSARAVEIADRVLQRALAAPRRAQLVRAAVPLEHLQVATTALVVLVREHLDARLPDAAVRRVLLDVERDGRLRGVTVDLVARFGAALCDVGDEARALAAEVLGDTLGEATVRDVPVDAHVSDVTVGDPHLVDPADERAGGA